MADIRKNYEVNLTEFGVWYEKYKALVTLICSLMVDGDVLN